MSALAADAASSAPVLEVEDLHTEFHLRTANVKAVDGVSFHVNPGECVGLVGESACGKTTVGLSIMKLLPNVGHIAGGSIRLFGRDLAPYDERQMRTVRGNEIGMIFQDPMTSLNPTWKIGRQIAEVVMLHREVSKAEAYQRALEVLTLVGMPRPAERLNTYPHQLSGGLRQRVMIAIALACEPKLLIADEPTTALDVTIQAQILNLIDELRDRLKMAVIMITHDLGVIAARSDRVMVMYAGKIVEAADDRGAVRLDAPPVLRGAARVDPPPRPGPHPPALLDLRPAAGPLGDARRLPVRPALPLRDRRLPRARNRRSRPRRGRLGGARRDVHCRPSPAREAHVFACYHPVRDRGRSGSPGAGSPCPTPRRRRVPAGAGSAEAASAFRGDVALEVHNLVKKYPVVSGAIVQRKVGTVQAVSDVSFSVRRGETFGLVGESGCGKTTIGRLVVALERPTSGDRALRVDRGHRAPGTGAAARRGATCR